MTDFKTLWWEKMLEKYGTEERIREIMSGNGKQGKGISKKSGFSGSSERAKEAGKKGLDKRWGEDNN